MEGWSRVGGRSPAVWAQKAKEVTMLLTDLCVCGCLCVCACGSLFFGTLNPVAGRSCHLRLGVALPETAKSSCARTRRFLYVHHMPYAVKQVDHLVQYGSVLLLSLNTLLNRERDREKTERRGKGEWSGEWSMERGVWNE